MREAKYVDSEGTKGNLIRTNTGVRHTRPWAVAHPVRRYSVTLARQAAAWRAWSSTDLGETDGYHFVAFGRSRLQMSTWVRTLLVVSRGFLCPSEICQNSILNRGTTASFPVNHSLIIQSFHTVDFFYSGPHWLFISLERAAEKVKMSGE
jgi:hypothetical protein